MHIRVYLDPQLHGRTLSTLKETFENFALKKGRNITAYYNNREPTAERTSLFRLLRDKGLAIASPARESSEQQEKSCQELFRLLADARPNDVLLIERTSTLTRLAGKDWAYFRRKIKERKIRIVSLDVEASWVQVGGESAVTPVAEHLTSMMLDMLEALLLKDKKEQRHRQLRGIARAKSKGKYKGRPVDQQKHEQILSLIQQGRSWSEVCKETGVSRSTIARAVKSDG